MRQAFPQLLVALDTPALRSADAFVLRRCQIVLASARGKRTPAIAQHLGCDNQTVREAICLTLKRLGIGWKRAKRWITSPDPEDAATNVAAIA